MLGYFVRSMIIMKPNEKVRATSHQADHMLCLSPWARLAMC